MPHRVVQSRLGRVRRRTLVGRVLGVSTDSSIDGLKTYLHAATLTESPDEKLDLVMVQDYDHFAELLAAEGVPLAREDDTGPTLPRRVVLSAPWYTWALVSLTVLAALGDDLLDWLY